MEIKKKFFSLCFLMEIGDQEFKVGISSIL